jgi:TonB-dependent SusC/RagA subfamily outer membrane receptor
MNSFTNKEYCLRDTLTEGYNDVASPKETEQHLYECYLVKKTFYRQIGRVMKLTFIFIMFALMNVYSNGYSQKVTLIGRHVPLEEFFSTIKQQTGYVFFYDINLLKTARPVTLNVVDVELPEALKMLFNRQPLDYSIENRTIVISERSTVPDKRSVNQPEFNLIDIRGRVVDSNGETLPGVSVRVKDTNIGTTTDLDGAFTLNVTQANAILVFTYIGYVTKEVNVGSQTRIDVVLEAANTALNEVVVIGYGTSNLANLTGSVSTVDVEKAMSSRPATNVASLLEGQVSGVFIHQNSGQPGAEGMNVLIRGQGSMGDSQPLVIVDGMESSMDNINPFDVESISVLKDAASASIYGTRAANGVLLVTTKRGKTGPIQIRYNTYFANQKPTAVPDFLGSADYARLHNEARANAGLSPTFSDDAIAKYEAGNDPDYPSTDWMDVLYSGSGASQYHGLDFSGGTEATRYNISMAYNQQNGVIRNVDADQANFRINLDNKINKWLNVGMNTAMSYAVNTIPVL